MRSGVRVLTEPDYKNDGSATSVLNKYKDLMLNDYQFRNGESRNLQQNVKLPNLAETIKNSPR